MVVATPALCQCVSVSQLSQGTANLQSPQLSDQADPQLDLVNMRLGVVPVVLPPPVQLDQRDLSVALRCCSSAVTSALQHINTTN